jgi:hypothetical protein
VARTASNMALGAKLPSIEALLSFALATFHATLMLRLRRGDLFNSYPFISDDGFDWIQQGLALYQHVLGIDREPWPMLRNPIYVVVGAIDFALGASGSVIIFSHAGGVFMALWPIGGLARKLGYATHTIAAIVMAQYFVGLGYLRLWILSDTLCIGLMTWSVCLLAIYQLQHNRPLMPASSAALASIAGLTQTYGIIPFCTTGTVLVLWGYLKSREVNRVMIAAVIAVPLSTFSLLKSWQLAIPHGLRPPQFELMQLSFDMLPFYLNVWSTTFPILLPLLALTYKFRRDRGIRIAPLEAGMLASVLAFVLLSFFYQWPESRFTFIYLSIVTVAIILLCAPCHWSDHAPQRLLMDRAVAIAFGVSALSGLFVVPGNYWRPTVRNTFVSWSRAWVGETLRAMPVDRLALGKYCGSYDRICTNVPWTLTASSPYSTLIFNVYRRRAGKLSARQ